MAQGTRGRQQEEQLATVIAVLHQQGERQEQVAEEQRQRHAELSAQFRQQVEELASNQQRAWEAQRQMEHRMTQLEGELKLTRESAFGRLDEAEERLRGVVKTEPQAAGTASLANLTHASAEVELQSGGHEAEMQCEEHTGSNSLIPSFSPSAGAVNRPPVFDGKTQWDAYLTQFQMLAQINGWTDAQKATYLAVSLKGPALTVLSNLPAGQLYNFQSLVSALDTRFGSAHQAELYRMRLKNRARSREESLPELAEDIERLTRLAYPNATAPMIEILAKDQFVDAIVDDESRLKVRQSRPDSLRQAVETALELESCQLASLRRGRSVRGATLSTGEPGLQNVEQKPQWVDDLMQCIQRCVPKSRPEPGDVRPRRRIVC